MMTNKLWQFQLINEDSPAGNSYAGSYAGSLPFAYTIAFVLSRLHMQRVKIVQVVLDHEVRFGL